ncbi:MAG: hypothetical protein ACR2QH_01190 [Geminicoccaceae bacterium]
MANKSLRKKNKKPPLRALPAVFKTSIINFIVLIFGAAIGLSSNFINKFDTQSILIVFLLVLLLCLFFCIYVISTSSNFYLNLFNDNIERTDSFHKDILEKVDLLSIQVDEVIKQRAELVDYKLAYARLAKRVRNAQESVHLLTIYTYDWENDERNFESTRLESKPRKDLFDALATAIKRENIEYTRIYQIDRKHKDKFQKVIKKDQAYYDEIDLLVKTSKSQPENAQLYVTDIYTEASFAIVDQSALFLNIEIREPGTTNYETPFVLYVEDLNREHFNGLVKMIHSIKAQNMSFNVEWDSE